MRKKERERICTGASPQSFVMFLFLFRKCFGLEILSFTDAGSEAYVYMYAKSKCSVSIYNNPVTLFRSKCISLDL